MSFIVHTFIIWEKEEQININNNNNLTFNKNKISDIKIDNEIKIFLIQFDLKIPDQLSDFKKIISIHNVYMNDTEKQSYFENNEGYIVDSFDYVKFNLFGDPNKKGILKEPKWKKNELNFNDPIIISTKFGFKKFRKHNIIKNNNYQNLEVLIDRKYIGSIIIKTGEIL